MCRSSVGGEEWDSAMNRRVEGAGLGLRVQEPRHGVCGVPMVGGVQSSQEPQSRPQTRLPAAPSLATAPPDAAEKGARSGQ